MQYQKSSDWYVEQNNYSAVQTQKAVSAYITSEQVLPFLQNSIALL